MIRERARPVSASSATKTTHEHGIVKVYVDMTHYQSSLRPSCI